MNQDLVQTETSVSREIFSGLRARGLALLLTLSAPGAMTFLSSCSPEKSEPQQPRFSTLVTQSENPQSMKGLSVDGIPARLASLGQLYGPLTDAMVALVAFGDQPNLQSGNQIDGTGEAVVNLKNTLTEAHRAVLNAGNDANFSPIQHHLVNLSTLISNMMKSVSTREDILEQWNPNKLDDKGQMKGVDIALSTQSALESMIGALDEDMAALIPGFEISRVAYLSEVVGKTKNILGDISKALTEGERDQKKLDDLKLRLSQNIAIFDAISKEPELVKSAPAMTLILKDLLKLHTGLAKDASSEELVKLSAAATSALEGAIKLEKETNEQLVAKQYSGSSHVYYPYYYHWFHTGHASPYSSWSSGASGFASTSRFSSPHISDTHVGGQPKISSKTFTSSRSPVSFGRVQSSGFKAGGFGGTGRSFGGVGVS